MSAQPHPKLPCPECDGFRGARAARCRSCYRRKMASQLLCPQCQTRYRSHSTAALCRLCEFQNRGARLICSGCNGRKTSARAKLCGTCRNVAGKTSKVRDTWRLENFDRHAFRRLLEREEWSVLDLAHATSLSSQMFYQWISGVRKPRRTEWRMVVEVLALDPCTHCGGTGSVNATDARIEAITAAVQRPSKTVLLMSPITEEQDWQLDPNRLVLTINGVEIRVTPQESRMVAAMAAAEGRYVPTDFISEAMRRDGRGPAPHAVHTYLQRLREKCEAAGVDLGRVVQNGRGAGYRAVMAAQEGVAS